MHTFNKRKKLENRKGKPMNQSEELLNIVDDFDVVIDTLTRGEIHLRNLKHRSVHLLVFDSAGRVYLQKRSLTKDNNPGLWDSSVSGHVDAGESYDSCVIREAQEEIGLHLKEVPEKLFKLDACNATGNEFTWIYRCISEGPFVLHPEEIDYCEWFTPETVDQWLLEDSSTMARSAQLIWRTYRSL